MELLKKLAQTASPSGNENNVRDIIISEIREFADEISVDNLGNLIARKKGPEKSKKIMLSAHMDEVGIIVTVIDDKKFAHFAGIGDVKLNALQGSKVKFANDVIGVIGEKSDKISKFDDLYLDIFDGCKGESLDKITVGDTAVFASRFDICGDFVSAKALDGRAGCYTLIKILKEIKSAENDIYFVFTVQEKLGLRGMKTAVSQIRPDYVITVDSAVCDDYPSGNFTVKLGEGPVIKLKDSSLICHPEIKRLISQTAENVGIKLQYGVFEKGQTDAGAAVITGAGTAGGALSIPVRHMGTACETASMSDIKNAITIITGVCSKAL